MDTMRKKLEDDFSFMSYAPIVFISAKDRSSAWTSCFETIHFVDIRTGTPRAHRHERDAGPCHRQRSKAAVRGKAGKRLKVFYITPISTRPPTFVCFVNPESAVPFLVPALFGKSDSWTLWPDRYAHPHDYP